MVEALAAFAGAIILLTVIVHAAGHINMDTMDEHNDWDEILHSRRVRQTEKLLASINEENRRYYASKQGEVE